jgi:hypothetical protein
MPKGKPASSTDPRISQLKAMAGTDFAMEVARDFVFLSRDERASAVRMLSALNETINREAKPA